MGKTINKSKNKDRRKSKVHSKSSHDKVNLQGATAVKDSTKNKTPEPQKQIQQRSGDRANQIGLATHFCEKCMAETNRDVKTSINGMVPGASDCVRGKSHTWRQYQHDSPSEFVFI